MGGMEGAWRMIAVAMTVGLLVGAGAWRLGGDAARREGAQATAVVLAAAQGRIDRAEGEAALLRVAKEAAEGRLAEASGRTRRGWCMARFERARADALATGQPAPQDRRGAMDACLSAESGGFLEAASREQGAAIAPGGSPR